ncbi:MAG: MFS transporter [Steroidobacteraceae bacterium]|nr:MFS transporter [Steroidobacteraceae bacterium]
MPRPADPGGAVAEWPYGRRYAWFVVVILMLAYGISMIDRNFLALVIEDVKADLGLSDLMVALILGPAFALFYMLLGVPIGWVADRVNRPRLMMVGMVLWCLATASCGLAGSFAALFAARLAVGVGEATLSPCALSIIADYFPARNRARAIGAYVSGAIIGAGVAYLLGSRLVEFMATRSATGWPAIDVLRPWQAALVVVGLLGLVVAVPMVLIAEPRSAVGGRHEQRRSGLSMLQALAVMRGSWQAYGGVLACVSCLFIVGYTHLWTVALFQRTWGWSTSQIGMVYGVLIVVTAFPGAALGGWISDRATRAGRTDGPIIALLWGTLIIGPTFTFYPLMPTGSLALAWLLFGWFAHALISAAGPAAIIQITGAAIRGQSTSWYYLVVNASGLFIGPPIVGALSDQLGGAKMLRYSVALVGCVFSGLALVALLATRRHYRDAGRRALAAAPAEPSRNG